MTDVTAHVTGVVTRIDAVVGRVVAAGDVIMILESMKMELPVEAPVAGAVLSIAVREGESVLEGDVVATLK